ncbi:Mer1p LALA0_S12e03004g [Lachancea lanzarotensis]|uniref:LALA0S12e03004g1_1 n=1 Tax=Lachancea lanzarotensis TaxID=1245769 RepID=A0A0C7NG04_9SACH|nr:uncharacterized protein LALA0_S12e03004g [Lachancea lanzarotensis]CEP64616.1 LALA0S12e03004g1_1 [Lachancea lanzarotensis]
MSALFRDGQSVQASYELLTRINLNKSSPGKSIPRSSPAEDEILELASAEELDGVSCTKTNEDVLRQLQLLFRDQVEIVNLRFPCLQGLEINQRTKVIVSKIRICEFLQQGTAAAIEVPCSQSGYDVFIRNHSYHSVVVECPLEKTFLQSLCGQNVCMLLSRELIHLLRTDNFELEASLMALNSRSVTLGGPSFDSLFEDMQRLVKNPFYRFPPRPWKSALAGSTLAFQETTPRVLGARKREMVTHDIKLNKAEITFLIGHLGTTIQRIREESGATIKIIPISSRLTQAQQNRPKSVEQHLSITGEIDAVTRAVCLIEAQLTLNRK